LFPRNVEICGGHRFSIPNNLVTEDRKGRFVDTSGEQYFIVDSSLVQMLKEINAEKKFLGKIKVDLEHPND
jgi:hypothetical protein